MTSSGFRPIIWVTGGISQGLTPRLAREGITPEFGGCRYEKDTRFNIGPNDVPSDIKVDPNKLALKRNHNN